MGHPTFTHSKIILLLALLIPLSSAGQVYTWVDDQGKKHFGDSPPENLEVEELDFSGGPTDTEIEAAQSELARSIESRHRRTTIEDNEQARTGQKASSQSEGKGKRLTQCAQARQQFAVLTRAQRIFKLGPDWSRTYQADDKDRDEEADQLENWIGANCEGSRDSIEEQYKLAKELNKKLRITCLNAREWFAKRAGQTLNEEEVQVAKRNREHLEEECPDVDYGDLWLADWMF